MRRRSKKSFLSQDDPDLTPLIDCVFQLLIFFMVTTVFVHARGVSVDLPVPTSAQDEQQRKDINIVLESSGRVEVSGEEVAWEHLEGRIARAMKENNNDNNSRHHCSPSRVPTAQDACATRLVFLVHNIIDLNI